MDYPSLIEIREDGVIFQPSHDFLLIEVLEAANITPGGIVLPANALEREQSRQGTYGVVVAAGNGNVSHMGTPIPMDHAVGDRVIVHPMSSNRSTVTIGGRKLICVRDNEVVGKLIAGVLPAPQVEPIKKLTPAEYVDLAERKALPAKWELLGYPPEGGDLQVLATQETSPARVASILKELSAAPV